MIKIDRDIPLPEAGLGRPGKQPKYPLRDLKVSESFAVLAAERRRLFGAAALWKTRHTGWDYVWRVEGEQIRIWRTA